MNLTNKLRKFLPQQNSASTQIPKTAVDLDPFLQGREVSTPYGACYVTEKSFALTDKHGHWPLHKVLQTTYGNLGQPFQIKTALFLDTETTGLAGGTGTYAFLVGLGSFTSTHFVVKQLLMRDFNEELALLYLLNEELQKKDIVVSFNGKTFDLPLLQTRFTISRLGFRGSLDKAQLDLLHMSRRFWRRKLESCSLSSLETHILGVTRIDDIPGYEIPGRYFEFLQTSQGELLKNIVNHNVIDIVSMATLLYRLQATSELGPQDCDCPFEAEALAQINLAEGNAKLSLEYLDAAKQLCYEEEHYIRILHTTALIFKRLRNYERASTLWEKIVKTAEGDLVAYEELAKYYEHRLKNLGAAEQVTRRALALAWRNKSPRIADLEHRLKRIESKISRQATQASGAEVHHGKPI